MILFCDTSALVKLYVHEDGTDRVTEQAAASDIIAVCRIAWVEAQLRRPNLRNPPERLIANQSVGWSFLRALTALSLGAQQREEYREREKGEKRDARNKKFLCIRSS